MTSKGDGTGIFNSLAKLSEKKSESIPRIISYIPQPMKIVLIDLSYVCFTCNYVIPWGFKYYGYTQVWKNEDNFLN